MHMHSILLDGQTSFNGGPVHICFTICLFHRNNIKHFILYIRRLNKHKYIIYIMFLFYINLNSIFLNHLILIYHCCVTITHGQMCNIFKNYKIYFPYKIGFRNNHELKLLIIELF